MHVAQHLSVHMGKLGIDLTMGLALTDVVVALRERAKILVELTESSVYFYCDFSNERL